MSVAARKTSRAEAPAHATSEFAADVLAGLTAMPKRLSPKYFYDRVGSELFERITELPEYYLTRCDVGILTEHADDIARLIADHAALIEFGSGSSGKTRIVLSRAKSLTAYVPVDVSAEFLRQQADTLQQEYPDIVMLPVVADFAQPFRLPSAVEKLPRAGFFPGSTIGNFEPHQAAGVLHNAARILDREAVFIVGVDLVKDTRILHKAYNDAAGVTAEFNLNLLARINRELGGNFDLASFEHHAFFNRERSRIEMHLASLKRQRVRVLGECIDFRAGETIHTENSYKYSIESFRALARGAGWTPLAVWTDPKKYFSVHVLRLRDVLADGPAVNNDLAG
jgi:dimethylhistidine N-methyltransferase